MRVRAISVCSNLLYPRLPAMRHGNRVYYEMRQQTTPYTHPLVVDTGAAESMRQGAEKGQEAMRSTAEMGKEQAGKAMESVQEGVEGARVRAGEMYEHAKRSGEQVRWHAYRNL